MTQPEEFTGRNMGNFSQIKKYRPSLEEEIDIKPRVAKGAVDKTWMKLRSHVLSWSSCLHAAVPVFRQLIYSCYDNYTSCAGIPNSQGEKRRVISNSLSLLGLPYQ